MDLTHYEKGSRQVGPYVAIALWNIEKRPFIKVEASVIIGTIPTYSLPADNLPFAPLSVGVAP